MAGFAGALQGIASRVPETQALMVMGIDGIPIEKLILDAGSNVEGSPRSTRRSCGRASAPRTTRALATFASSQS